MKRVIVLVAIFALCSTAITPAHGSTVKGLQGQILSVSSTVVKAGSTITVTGKYFDETIGIYLGFCVVPKRGQPPSPCGGGVNKVGIGDASYWISSNPPIYGVGLAEEFLPGGRFTRTVKIVSKIGKYDCRKIRCAVTIRADHMRSQDRTYDLFIPMKIK